MAASRSTASVARLARAGGAASARVPHNKRREAMDAATWERIKDHPCYSEDAHHYFARMHVAVAPGCNIQCNYCNRKYDCSNESRPGVVSGRLTPEGALAKVRNVAARLPQLSVVGIAGPGDALFQAERTLKTFELIRAALPDLTLCLSTNGLALPDHVDALKALDIGHVTITINYLDPEIGAEIYPWIFHNHKRWKGVEAARILHERQMEGLERAVEAGVLVKVNSVMIPGINDEHLTEVNTAVRARGAFLHNVMPLISDPAHGTKFGLEGRRGPSPAEIHTLRESLGNDARLMKHCRQCRADAVGMLGEDQCQSIDTMAPAATADDTPRPDPEIRAAWREVVADSRAAHKVAADEAEAVVAAAAPAAEDRLVAVCTRGGARVNLHFGKATEFHIYKVGAEGIRFAGIRRADNYCLGGYGESERLDTILTVLEGVSAMVCVKVGDGPRRRLEAAGIACHQDTRHETIETVIADWYADAVGAPMGAVSQPA
ncbi:nitrogenase cofactor biosynthesis protein NifB [Roseospira marina]|uniref:FeMo cofactor biosynthesis protein NifB n=2 Tax=Roseospira marina TaxID=140057 RepID=A0A5M6IIJ6_9PROT|nr:nitrogenase cofactor biosynthesis protein NifB [Roseospira marina]